MLLLLLAATVAPAVTDEAATRLVPEPLATEPERVAGEDGGGREAPAGRIGVHLENWSAPPG